jgi:AraC-like DNA-binding protein
MTNEEIIVTVTFACCAAAHFTGLSIMGILARHRVQYLSLAWILAIFAVVSTIVAIYGKSVAAGAPGILNPYMLLVIDGAIFLQSIYSLGLIMPGFLQLERMLKYASPIVILAIVYMIAIFPAGKLTLVFSAEELFNNIVSLDMILRLIALGLGVYYTANIILLPRRIAYKTSFPMSLFAYIVVLVASIVLYLYTAFDWTPYMICAYAALFTVVNFFWVCHTMEILVVNLPHPDIKIEVTEKEEIVTNEQAEKDEQAELSKLEEAYEMNQKRYMRVQLWMQNNKEAWKSNRFTRDKLCEETGINRQLMLQCLRSQGHNNIHEYITAYRVEELKRLIRIGEISSISDCDIVGFTAPKTARSCFERIEGKNLDEYIQQHKKEQ